MAWYDTGTVSVTNGSTTVTGSGTDFVSGAQVGEAFYGPDDNLYEIQAIVSATQLTLADAYLGSTQTGQAYKIVPTQSLVADLATQVSTLISDFQSVADNAGEGKFDDGSATSPAITFTQDQDTGFFRDTANEIGIAVAGAKIGEFNSSGLTLGDNNKAIFGAGSDLQIYHDGTNSYITDTGTGDLIIDSNGNAIRLKNTNGENMIVADTDASAKLFHNGSEKLATTATGIDVTGTVTAESLGIGTSSPSYPLDVSGSSFVGIQYTRSGTDSPAIRLSNATTGSLVQVEGNNSGDVILKNGAGSLTEAMRIDNSGNLLVGKTATGGGVAGTELQSDGLAVFVRDGNRPMIINRETNDGDLVSLRQNNSIEGSISVSGTTVSYNGGHLARWSRLPDGTDDSNILKGTVMTNLDQMIEWVDENGVAEDNEQLNFTNVSSLEGDPNVAGVFVAWDESDDWGDYYLAMTGDMVIRIGAGVTVQQGDLLMSAGDGTAKPQDDDIVRSKTIAKVISTNKSHEYPDGSYAVPCVLMAC